METEFNNLSSLEKKALQLWNSLSSGDEFQKRLACDNLEKDITLGGRFGAEVITNQKHYSLLGSALFYLLTTKEPDSLPYSLNSQMILMATHYCLLRYVRDSETGRVEMPPSEYAGALKRAYICSKIFNDNLYYEVYSLADRDRSIGNRIVNSLYCRLQQVNVQVRCDEVTETLYFMQRLQQDTSVVYDCDRNEEKSVNEVIDKLLQKYYKYVMEDLCDRIRDEVFM